MHVENTCFHIWHANGRDDAWGNIGKGFLPTTKSVRFSEQFQTNESDSSTTLENGTLTEDSLTSEGGTDSDGSNTESL